MAAQSQRACAEPQLGGRARGGAATCACARGPRKAEAEVGGASAPKEGAPAASVRSGVAMGRGSGTFERLLGNASASQLAVSSLAHPPDAASIGLRGCGPSALPGRRPPGSTTPFPGLGCGLRGCAPRPGRPVRDALWESTRTSPPPGLTARNRLGQSPES